MTLAPGKHPEGIQKQTGENDDAMSVKLVSQLCRKDVICLAGLPRTKQPDPYFRVCAKMNYKGLTRFGVEIKYSNSTISQNKSKIKLKLQ